METGPHYEKNQLRMVDLTEADWKVAIAKCKEHIKWRLKQKMLSGAHTASNLGADPIDHYLGLCYEKILTGEWEWKEKHTLAAQLIRIANSCISKEVEKIDTQKSESFKTVYKDVESEFYDLTDPPDSAEENGLMETRLNEIESAIRGDERLELMVDALKEGMKRTEIAELMEIKPKQFDKLREKLLRKIENYHSSNK